MKGRQWTSNSISGRISSARARRLLPMKHQGQTVSDTTSICMESTIALFHALLSSPAEHCASNARGRGPRWKDRAYPSTWVPSPRIDAIAPMLAGDDSGVSGSVGADAFAAVALGAVEGLVGAAQERLGRVVRALGRGDADGDGEAELAGLTGDLE